MKEKRHYKRFDLFAVLAVVGTLAVLLFESFFVFELYTREFEPVERFLSPGAEPAAPESVVDPAAPESAVEPLAPESEEMPAPVG